MQPCGYRHAFAPDAQATPAHAGMHSPSDIQPAIVHPGNAHGNDRKFLSTFFVDKSVDETLEKSLRA
jgi:hypothetical protein